jgi:glycosyltransferase involved in cell wall biosynthesis
MLKFSIVTCTWNSDQYLEQTIRSINSQSHSNLEVVFVDGGSTDSTLHLIDEFAGPKILLRDVRGGIANAMNAGLNAASGDVVVHLHSDDYFLHSHVLSRVAKYFEEHDCDWLFGRILNDRDGGLYPETYIPPKYSYAALLRSNIIPHAATFVKRSLFNKVGAFSAELKLAMDYDMWLRMGRVSTPHQLKEALSVFRRHDGSATEKNQLASFEEDHRLRMKYADTGVFDRTLHQIRYSVRKGRLLKRLQGSAL